MIEKRFIKDRDEWLSWRREDVTASDVGALLGIHDYKTPLHVYAEKSGNMGDQPMNDAMERGILMEPAVALAVQRRHPKWEIVTPNYYLRDAERHIGCTPDRITADGKINIQLKTVGRRKWLSDWQDGPPFSYQLQTLCEAMLQGAESSLLAILITSESTLQYEEYEVPRNAEAEQRIYNAVKEFWHDIDVGFMPEPDYEKDGAVIKALWQPIEGTNADWSGNNHLHELCVRYESARFDEKEAAGRKETVKNEIIHKLNGFEAVKCNEFKISRKLIPMKERIMSAHVQDRLNITQPKGRF